MPRELSEQEFNEIKQRVLASLPKNLTEEQFNRMAPSVLDGAIATAEQSPTPLQGSSLGRFFSGTWDTLNPLPVLEAFVNPDARLRMATGMGMAASDQYDQMRAAPTLSEKVSHGVAAAVPGLGPSVANAAYSGDLANVLGQATGTVAAPFAVRDALPATVRGAQRARTAASAPADVALSAMMKRLGIDPTQIDLQTARLNLQRVRSQARIAAGKEELAAGQAPRTAPAPETPARRIVRPTAKADKLADSPITPDMEDMVNRMTGGADAPTPGNGTYREDVQIPPATSPVETPAAPSARQLRASGARRSGGRVPTLTPEQTQAARDLTDAGYSLSEVTQILDDLNHGVSSDQALKRVQVSRELLKTDAFRQTPTLEEVMKANEVRNRRYQK